MVVEAARATGWDAATEVSGSTPSGEEWRADVLARKGDQTRAVEVQWSAQTVEETYRRQARYAEAGIRCLWLIRRGICPNDRSLPIAGIGGSLDAGITALIPTGAGQQQMPMQEFLRAAFGGRLRFGLPLGIAASVSVQAGHLFCWKCGAETRIITGVEVDVGSTEYRLSVPDLNDYPDLFDVVRRQLPGGLGIGNVKRRFSQTVGRAYLSNGCVHCDALVGGHYEHDAWDDQKEVCRFSLRVDERWREAIRGDDGYEEGWGVYSFDEHP
jgi:competence protein CoiA